MTKTPWVDGLTIGEVQRRTAERFPDRDAAVFPQAGMRYTWREFDAEVVRVARSLLALGLTTGDHFGVWGTNWPEWLLLQFATARVGIVLVTVNPSYRPGELAFALRQSDVRGLAMIDRYKSTSYDDTLEEACPEFAHAVDGWLDSATFPKLKSLVRMRGEPYPGLLSWESFLEKGDAVDVAVVDEACRATEPGDPVNLQYTSGTTGHPKGALLTHRNLLLNAYYTGECQRFDEADRIAIPVPLYHCFGCVLGTMTAVVRGAAMIFPHESFRPAETLAAIESERCTAIYGVPTMFIAELEHESYAKTDTSSLRTGIMAGSPCPIELMKRVTSEMGASEITIGYGQTESSPIITMTRTDDSLEHRVGTVGKVIPGVEARVVDPETGNVVPDGTEGELCCRGHNVMAGYYRQPEATAAAIDPDGWLHTGDLAVRRPDGYFRITGRLKDLIVRGGENVSPREIEETLYEHPAVEDVQVVGVPDEKYGEAILACIIVRAGQDCDEDSIRDFCRDRLAHFKTPKYVWFVDEFPLTVSGKVRKVELRQQAIERFELGDAASVETA